MQLNTRYHGIKEYNEEDIITFKKGLPGFEELTRFIIFPVEENDTFNILHSIEDEEIGIIVVAPFGFKKDYEIDIDETVTEHLKIEKETDVVVVNTVTISTMDNNITVNLKAPIIVNIKERLGEQIILDNQDYLIKYPLFQE